jgi:hypothetical protein
MADDWARAGELNPSSERAIAAASRSGAEKSRRDMDMEVLPEILKC